MNIKAHDTVKHLPSGEEWTVCGVNYDAGYLVPCGYPFPTTAKISDCVLIESSDKEQSEEFKHSLHSVGYGSYISPHRNKV